MRAMELDQRSNGFETAHSIVEATRGVGKISKDTLAKWHRGGLIPQPITVSLGRGKGSESRYPIGTSALVDAILRARMLGRRRLEDLAWELWWRGYCTPITTIRKRLERFAANWDKCLSSADFENELKGIESQRLPKSVSRIRKRVGRKKIHSIAMAMLSVASDRVDDSAIDNVDERTYEQAFNLKRARREHTREAGPFIQTDQREIMHLIGPILRGRSLVDTLATYSDSDITNARDSFQNVMRVMGHAGAQLGQTFGKGAFGFDALRELATSTDWSEQALIILVWPLLMTRPEFNAGIETYRSSGEMLAATDRGFERMRLLRVEIPDLANTAAPNRIGAAQKNKKKQAHLNAEVRRIRKTHGRELDAFFTRHGSSTKSRDVSPGSSTDKPIQKDNPRDGM